jgi:cytochrome c551/c552
VIGRPVAFLAAGAVVAGTAFWTARDDGASSSGPVAPAVDGASLFRAKGCSGCHQGPGVHSAVGIAPVLDDAADWAATRIPGTSAEDYVRQSIVDPQAFISPAATTTLQMPTLPLSAAELDALVTFLLEPRAED